MSERKRKPAPKPQTPEYPITFETFRRIGAWEMNSLTNPAPGCFNGEVSIRKHRVTVEIVEEPIETLQQRVQDLWDHETNYHHHNPLQSTAKSLGMPRLENMGAKVRKSYE